MYSIVTVSSTITPLMPLCWHISGVSEPTLPETATTSGRTLLAVSKIAAIQDGVDIHVTNIIQITKLFGKFSKHTHNLKFFYLFNQSKHDKVKVIYIDYILRKSANKL